MKPYHKNPRQINKKQFDQLKENLAYLGDLSGIVHDLNSNEIIGGNQRSNVFDVNKCDVEIAHQYDYPDEQGTVAHGFIIWQGKRYTYRQVRWTPKQCEQANITANRLGGEWDFDELANWDMSELLEWGFEESDFPFDVTPAIGAGTDTEPQIDKAEELRAKWGVESGQMWQLGRHKIVCGDCTDKAVVERVMGGEKAQIIFTDPPYGVAIGAKNRMLNSFQKAGRNLTDIEDDEMSPEDLKQRLLPAFNLIRTVVMAEDCTVFLTSPQGGDLCMMMMMMMKEAGLAIRHVLIWKKNAPTFSMGRLDYDYQHEPILLTWGKRHKRPMNGTHKNERVGDRQASLLGRASNDEAGRIV